MKKQGFTLIELLVVVAIIGILATVVLASLNNARAKALDAKIKAQLQSIHPASRMNYDSIGNYDSICTDESIAAMVASATATCTDGSAAFVVYKALSSGTWCVDSTGYTGLLVGTTTNATTNLDCNN